MGATPTERAPVRKSVLLGIVGFLIGIPLSYYFQSETVRSKLSLGQYLGHLPELLKDHSGDFLAPLILACAVASIAGIVVGHLMDQKKKM